MPHYSAYSYRAFYHCTETGKVVVFETHSGAGMNNNVYYHSRYHIPSLTQAPTLMAITYYLLEKGMTPRANGFNIYNVSLACAVSGFPMATSCPVAHISTRSLSAAAAVGACAAGRPKTITSHCEFAFMHCATHKGPHMERIITPTLTPKQHQQARPLCLVYWEAVWNGWTDCLCRPLSKCFWEMPI